jgi:phosphotransferase system HPr-like phosphotransfer protein
MVPEMTKFAQSPADVVVLENVKVDSRFKEDVFDCNRIQRVAKRFQSDVYIAADGVAVDAKGINMFNTIIIFNAFVTVGAKGPDANAAVNAVATFLASAQTGDRE